MTIVAMRPLTLVTLSAAWITVSGNTALIEKLADLGLTIGSSGWQVSFVLLLLVFVGTIGIASLAAWPRVLKITLAALLLITASASHFMGAYGVVMDPTMLTNVLETDVREAGALLSVQAVLKIFLLGVIPATLVCSVVINFDVALKQAIKNLGVALLAVMCTTCLLAISYKDMASLMRNHKEVRYLLNPLASIYSVARVAIKPFEIDSDIIFPVGNNLKIQSPENGENEPFTLILVLGETARSENFSLNGYERQTNPTLQGRGAVSFRNAWSCGTSTAESLPCMFSHLGREGFNERDVNYENLLDVLAKSGLAVLWLDNQSGCKKVCARVPFVDANSLCPSGECFDEVMLHGLSDRLAQIDNEKRAKGTVIVLHQMGSHGPAYYRRSPDSLKKFLPECKTNVLKDCSVEELRNAYDNSIRYTDHFLEKTIKWLEANNSNSALMYVSDHGESLGESNIYLHGLPYAIAPDYQKRIPWITWFSSKFQRTRKISTACLDGKTDDFITHDNYFHSALGLAGIVIDEYVPTLDIYRSCRG